MVRNLIFAVLFGVLFYLPLAFMLVPDDIPTYLDSWWLLLGLVAGLLVLRWFTDLTEKAHRVGGRVTGRMMGAPPKTRRLRPKPRCLPARRPICRCCLGLWWSARI